MVGGPSDSRRMAANRPRMTGEERTCIASTSIGFDDLTSILRMHVVTRAKVFQWRDDAEEVVTTGDGETWRWSSQECYGPFGTHDKG